MARSQLNRAAMRKTERMPMMGKMKAAMPMKAPGKADKVMHEFKAGSLHSGSKSGPPVTNRKQAVAIALSEARKGKKG